MPDSGYFESKRDKETINAGGFFCFGCLTGKPASKLSPDPRYCQGCYDLFLKEAEMLSPGRRSQWAPRVPRKPLQPASGVGHNYIGTPGQELCPL